ncbi:MAG: UxaA family hydrolase [Enterococcus sp.]
MKKIMQLHPEDNVVVALCPIEKGETIEIEHVQPLIISEDIPQGHKIALTDLTATEDIIKYGAPIGHATEEITRGQWLHTHNVKTNLHDALEYSFQPNLAPVEQPKSTRTFQGYRRANNKVGIRNDLLIVPTVGCINGIAELIVKEFKEGHETFEPFDNITILKHAYGCSQLGQDHENTRQVLADAVKHPNAGGVLVFGLGCENNTMAEFKKLLGEVDTARVKFLIAQEEEDEISAGVALLEEIYEAAQGDHREEIPLSELKIGLKCGGSDGFSGITANPLLGRFSDFVVAQGGSTVLTEVPEMFGAEHLLMARAENEEVFEEVVSLINRFKEYFLSYGEPVYENPSPGNKAGGITTLEDKSLGCTQKSGTSAVVDVLRYGDKIRKPGLSLLEGPGNDLVAASNLASSDCQLVLFTTGRGTPFGSYVPTLKVATNDTLYNRKKHWMDFNAGRLLSEDQNDVFDDFVEKIIAVASGEPAKNEVNEFRELAIFKTGVTL